MLLRESVSSSTRIVTLLGEVPLRHPWVPLCLRSWRRIHGVDPTITVLSDGRAPLSQSSLSSTFPELDLRLCRDQEAMVAEALAPFSALGRVRDHDISWRKLVDTVITQRGRGRVLLIDTDVVVRAPVSLPHQRGFIYTREDIPAYRGRWTLPLREPLVLSFNAGFVLFDPDDVSLEFLDTLCRRYFLGLGFTWWTEQAAWAALAALAPARFRFEGSSACTLSGLATRTARDVRANRVRFLSSPRRLSGRELAAQAGNAPVVHMSGMAKQHHQAICAAAGPIATAAAATELRAEPDGLISWPQRLLLAARLFSLGIKDRRSS